MSFVAMVSSLQPSKTPTKMAVLRVQSWKIGRECGLKLERNLNFCCPIFWGGKMKDSKVVKLERDLLEIGGRFFVGCFCFNA